LIEKSKSKAVENLKQRCQFFARVCSSHQFGHINWKSFFLFFFLSFFWGILFIFFLELQVDLLRYQHEKIHV